MRTAHARILIAALTIVAMSVLAPAAVAQTVVDATTVEFEPSADHSAVAPDGTPIVTFYLLEFGPVGSSASHSIDLGKPAPAADGLIRVTFTSQLPSPLVGGTVYQARISAVGPGGRGTSEPSNSFASSAPCAPALSAANMTLASGASTGTILVTAGATCAWTATVGASWLSIASGVPGAGSSAVVVAATANAASSPRTGTLTIAGQTVTVTQSGASAPCSPVLSTSSASVAATVSTGSITVTDGVDCVWMASANNSWLSITSAMPVMGTGTVDYRASANSSTSQRTGTLTIAGRTVTITQAPNTPRCTYTIDPTSRTAPTGGETTTVAVTASSGCSWSATSGASWLAVTAGASGSGNGTVTIRASGNSGTNQRMGAVSIAGRPFTVTQPGSCNFTVTPAGVTASATGTTSTVWVSTNSGCSWSATGAPSWITVPSGTRTGSGNLTYTVSVNGGAARSVTLTIAGRSVAINQNAATVPSPTNFRIIRTQEGGQH